MPEETKIETKVEEEKGEGEETPEGTKVTVEGEEETPTGEEEPEPEGGLSASQKEEAERLYSALMDPRSAPAMVAALGAKFGINLTQPQSREEVKEVKKDIKSIVSQALGKDYEFLADRLGTAIESAVGVIREEHQQELLSIRQNGLERDTKLALDGLASKTKGDSRKMETRMSALADEIPIGNMSVDTYVRRLYDLAVAEGQRSNSQGIADKIRRNANDAPGRLKGTPGSSGRDVKIPDKKMSLDESVKFAFDSLTGGSRK